MSATALQRPCGRSALVRKESSALTNGTGWSTTRSHSQSETFPRPSSTSEASVSRLSRGIALTSRPQQNVYYNAFTAPPTNQSSFRGWDTGSIYPGFLVVAEALGPLQTSQVVEITSVANASNQSYVGYTVYEVRLAPCPPRGR